MLNNVIIVGRLVDDPVVKTLESGLSVCNVVLAVTRSFKNPDGEYDTDFIRCSLWEGVANAMSDYCTKGSVIGVKGRLISKENEVWLEEGGEKKKITTVEVVGDRVSFIDVKKNV